MQQTRDSLMRLLKGSQMPLNHVVVIFCKFLWMGNFLNRHFGKERWCWIGEIVENQIFFYHFTAQVSFSIFVWSCSEIFLDNFFVRARSAKLLDDLNVNQNTEYDYFLCYQKSPSNKTPIGQVWIRVLELLLFLFILCHRFLLMRLWICKISPIWDYIALEFEFLVVCMFCELLIKPSMTNGLKI